MAPCDQDALSQVKASAVVAIFNVNMIGHLNPTFALVQELVERGCQVHYFLPPDESIREAARESGAVIESYLQGDPEGFVLENCGTEARDSVDENERDMWVRARWPLASALASGEHMVARCRELNVEVVLYDPMLPHGLLVAELLGLPCVSLVTYPGMGSIAAMMVNKDRLERAKQFRSPLAEEIRQRFGVDVQDQLLTRRQYYAEENFVTTCDDLVAPLPPQGAMAWADELREHFRFTAIGCMVSEHAPHVISARKPCKELCRAKSFGHALPEAQLKAAADSGKKIIFVALGTMALSDRWAQDLGRASGGNLPAGTTGKAYCQHVWGALLGAMRGLHDQFLCVVSLGTQSDALDFLSSENDEAELLPENVIVRSFVPQVDMLNNYADVFVSHAGFNSMQESLMAGVPLIAVPQAVDQPANAQKIEASGWGRAFLKPMETVSPEALAAALREVAFDQGRYQAQVSKAKQQLQGGHKRAADKLLELAAERRRRSLCEGAAAAGA